MSEKILSFRDLRVYKLAFALQQRVFKGNCSGSGAGVSPAMGASRPRSHPRGRVARSGRRDACPTT
jgi:hypothetical protein